MENKRAIQILSMAVDVALEDKNDELTEALTMAILALRGLDAMYSSTPVPFPVPLSLREN
jgi:hypothetical protein